MIPRVALGAHPATAVATFRRTARHTALEFGRPTGNLNHACKVVSGMFASGHDGQIFDPVVGLNVIDVVDDLVFSERSPKVLFHQPAVIFDLSTARQLQAPVSEFGLEVWLRSPSPFRFARVTPPPLAKGLRAGSACVHPTIVPQEGAT